MGDAERWRIIVSHSAVCTVPGTQGNDREVSYIHGERSVCLPTGAKAGEEGGPSLVT